LVSAGALYAKARYQIPVTHLRALPQAAQIGKSASQWLRKADGAARNQIKPPPAGLRRHSRNALWKLGFDPATVAGVFDTMLTDFMEFLIFPGPAILLSTT